MNNNVDANPRTFLQSVNFKKGERKVLILETVERHSPINLLRLAAAHQYDDKDDMANMVTNINEWIHKHIIVLNNDNKDYDYFFRRNVVTYPITKWIANLRFKLLGEIDHQIGAYSLPSKMLFYTADLSFSFAEKPEGILRSMAHALTEFSHKLKQEYNIDLVYVIIPNKYSIYNDLANKSYFYDNYIPRITEKLRTKGMHVIDLYSIYMNYRKTDDSKLLYFRSDTHFTPLGKELLRDAVLKELKNLGIGTNPS